MKRKPFFAPVLVVFAMIGCSSDSDSQNTNSDSVAAGDNTGTVGTAASATGASGAAGDTLSVPNSSVDGASATVSSKDAAVAQTDDSRPNTRPVDAAVTKHDAAAPPKDAAGVNTNMSPVGNDSATVADSENDNLCDRSCLIGYISNYLDAMVAHDPSLLKTSPTVRFTLNGVDAQLGDGLWQTATQIQVDKRLDFADPLEGQVATQTVVDENGISPVIYQVRLKVVEGEITEIESMEVRRGDAANGFFNVENMKPQPVFLQEIEPSRRMSREELRAVMELYMDYLEGKKHGSELPFDASCIRFENGQRTANGVADFERQSFWRFQVTRRYLVFDEEAGIVWGMFPFYQSDFTLVVGEAFKLIDGNFMMIQAVMAYMPSKAWD